MKFFILLFLSCPVWAATNLSFVTGCQAAATSCTLSGTFGYAHGFNNDVAVVFAYNSGSTTIPTLATGYTSIDAPAASNANAFRTGWHFLQGNETTCGTWTNATQITCLIYRGADIRTTGPIGGHASGKNTATAISFCGTNAGTGCGTLTFSDTSGASFLVGFSGTTTGTTDTCPATISSLRFSTTTNIAACDTNAGVSAFTTSAGATASAGWASDVIEVLSAPTGNSTPTTHVTNYDFAHSSEASTTPFTYTVPGSALGLGSNLAILSITYTSSVTPVVTEIGAIDVVSTGPSGTDAGDALKTTMYYVCGANAGVTGFSVTMSAASADFSANVEYFSGVATSSCNDGSGVGATIGQSSNPIMSAGSQTTGTNGDIVYQYCISTINGLNTEIPAALFAPANNLVISVNPMMGEMSQAVIQGTAGAVKLSQQQWGGAASSNLGGNCVAQAFKTAAAGTAPSGMYIAHQRFAPATTASPYVDEFPAQGNLVLLASSQINNGLSAVSDGNSHSFTVINNAGFPEYAYLPNVLQPNIMMLSVTWPLADTPFYWLYDIVGAASSPFDTSISCSAPSTKTGTGGTTACTHNPTQSGTTVSNCPNISPSTATGIVFDVCATGTGPMETVSSPTGGILDGPFYTGMTDASLLTRGDGYAHFLPGATTSEAWNWTLPNSGSTASNGVAIHFLPATAASTPPLFVIQ